MRFLGIDPGLRITGYGCVDGSEQEPGLIEAGVFRLGRGGAEAHRTAPAKVAPIPDRLLDLDADIQALLARLRPDVIAIEALFAHYRHPATAILMGHARGVILLAARRTGARLVEVRPAAVKRFLTGSGRAEKHQMQDAIQMHLRLTSRPEPPDVADALAIALYAASRVRAGVG
jgi:crossover junction endodeoxyribonuclease RuvC